MTPQEFQTKLEELINQAPEESTIFLTSSNKVEGSKTLFYSQGKVRSILTDVSLFACKNSDVKQIVNRAADIAANPFMVMMSEKF